MSARATIREKLARREPVFGCSVDYPSLALAQLLGQQFDLVFVDCEHGGPSPERVAELAMAVQTTSAVTVLRPWSKDPGLIRRYLDCGIDGLIWPETASAADIAGLRNIVAASSPPDAENLIVIGLVESADGLANLDELLASPELDAVLLGPGDLAVSLGLPRQGSLAQLREVALAVLEKAQRAGRSAGVPIGRYGLAEMRAAGATLFMYAAADLLKDGIATARKEFDAAGK